MLKKSLDKQTVVPVLLLIVVLSAIFGFVYETLFYRIDLGHFVKRGTTYGPWIPIYGVGGLLITLVAYRFKKMPVVVFALGALVSGALEFLTGYLLFHLGGIRLWDYNVEIWNWGNVGGYICLRSVFFLGVSGLLLTYVIVPAVLWLASKCRRQTFRLIAVIPALLFFADILLYKIIHI